MNKRWFRRTAQANIDTAMTFAIIRAVSLDGAVVKSLPLAPVAEIAGGPRDRTLAYPPRQLPAYHRGVASDARGKSWAKVRTSDLRSGTKKPRFRGFSSSGGGI
jgi:hypothetical protein